MPKLNIFTNELMRRYRGALIWVITLFLYALMMIAFADAVFEQSEQLLNVLDAFGSGFLAIFGAEVETFARFEGFFVGEYATLGMIGGAIFAGYMGANTIGGEIKNKTIGLVLSRPVSRLSVFFSKFTANTLLILTVHVILLFSSYLSAQIFIKSTDVPFQYFLNVYIGMFVFVWTSYCVGQALGTIIGDAKALGAIVMLSFVGLVLNFAKSIESIPDQVQWLNPYYYISLAEFSKGNGVNELIIVPLLLGIGSIALGAWWFSKRNINL